MKKDTLLNKLICLLWVFIGSAICGLGIQLTLVAGVGVDPLTMFQEGASKTTGISVGTAALLLNVFMLTMALIFMRSTIGWGSIVCTFSVGPFINVWGALGLTTPQSFLPALLLDVVGVVVIGLGIALYMLPEYGIGGNEAMMLFFSKKLKAPIGITRISMDCTWGLLGLLLGGTIGIGTLVGAVGIGICIQFFYTQLGRLVKK